MKKALWVLSALALVGFGFAGCGGEEECGDGYVCDNEEFCDGQCSGTENCFGEDADGKVICSKCEYDCALMFPDTFKNCNEAAGLCMNDATCPAGMVAQSNNNGTGLCVGGEQKTCQSNTDCGDGEVCGSDNLCVAEGSVETKFRYVRIEDMSDPCEKKDGKCTAPDPGADIDAVVLIKSAGGGTFNATAVAGYSRSDGIKGKDANDSKVASDPSEALGAPDSFDKYASGSSGGECIYWKDKDAADPVHPYVSLGGQGGYLILEMGADIEKGDTLDILEVGGCSLKNTSDGGNQTAQGEKISISIAVSGDSETWNPVGEKTSDKDNKGLLSFALTDDKYFK